MAWQCHWQDFVGACWRVPSKDYRQVTFSWQLPQWQAPWGAMGGSMGGRPGRPVGSSTERQSVDHQKAGRNRRICWPPMNLPDVNIECSPRISRNICRGRVSGDFDYLQVPFWKLGALETGDSHRSSDIGLLESTGAIYDSTWILVNFRTLDLRT